MRRMDLLCLTNLRMNKKNLMHLWNKVQIVPVRNVLVYTLPQMNINNNFKFYKNAKTEDKFRRKEEIHVHRYW